MPVRLGGATSGYTELAASAAAGNNTITMPSGNGSAYQLLRNGATPGATEWSDKILSGTAQASTSGTFIDFTGIPAGVKRVTVLFSGVSTTGTVDLLMQLGVGSTPTTSGYLNGQSIFSWGSGILSSTSSAGIPIYNNAAAYVWTGRAVFERLDATSNNWVATITLNNTQTSPAAVVSSGVAVLSGALGMVRITTTTGTPTFDLGTINILCE